MFGWVTFIDTQATPVCGHLDFSYLKGDSNPNYKYVLSERALWTMNFDTSIIKIGRLKNGEAMGI